MNAYLPLFSYLFGMTPRQVEDLDVEQWQAYREFADQFRPKEA